MTGTVGLRCRLNPPCYETRDGLANFNLGPCSLEARVVPGGCDQGFIHVAGLNGSDNFDRRLMTTDYTNFAPRFGLAYKLTEKAVLRMAYGIFYGNMSNTGGAGSWRLCRPSTSNPVWSRAALSQP